MGPTPESESTPREFRVEGWSLFAVAALLLLALAGAFWLGRWFERSTDPAGRTSEAPLSSPAGGGLSTVDTTEDASIFDRVGEGASRAEPRREVERPEAAETGPPTKLARPDTSQPGSWWVQVFAGRDRQSADELAARLRGRGWPVAVHEEREGTGALYKVRVGGYESRAEADRTAGSLRDAGEPRAWVVQVD